MCQRIPAESLFTTTPTSRSLDMQIRILTTFIPADVTPSFEGLDELLAEGYRPNGPAVAAWQDFVDSTIGAFWTLTLILDDSTSDLIRDALRFRALASDLQRWYFNTDEDGLTVKVESGLAMYDTLAEAADYLRELDDEG